MSFIPFSSLIRAISVHIVEIRKQDYREVKWLAQGDDVQV